MLRYFAANWQPRIHDASIGVQVYDPVYVAFGFVFTGRSRLPKGINGADPNHRHCRCVGLGRICRGHYRRGDPQGNFIAPKLQTCMAFRSVSGVDAHCRLERGSIYSRPGPNHRPLDRLWALAFCSPGDDPVRVWLRSTTNGIKGSQPGEPPW